MGRFTDFLGLTQPRTGRLVAEDGSYVNQADVLADQGAAAMDSIAANGEHRQEEFSNRSLLGYAFAGSEDYTIPAGETADFLVGGNAPEAIQVHSLSVTLGPGAADLAMRHGAGYSLGNAGANLYNDADGVAPASQALTARKDGATVESTADLLSTFYESPASSSVSLADGIITVGAGRSVIVSVANTGDAPLRCAFSALWVETTGGTS